MRQRWFFRILLDSLSRVAGYRRSHGEHGRPFIRSTSRLRTRQLNGLDISTAHSASPLRATYILPRLSHIFMEFRGAAADPRRQLTKWHSFGEHRRHFERNPNPEWLSDRPRDYQQEAETLKPPILPPISREFGWDLLTEFWRRFETNFLAPQMRFELMIHLLTAIVCLPYPRTSA